MCRFETFRKTRKWPDLETRQGGHGNCSSRISEIELVSGRDISVSVSEILPLQQMEQFSEDRVENRRFYSKD